MSVHSVLRVTALFVSFVIVIAAAPPGISTAGDAYNGDTFDYVVVGGGTSGLVVASRLSEDPGVTVAIIEAGVHGIGEPAMNVPDSNLYNSSLYTSRDWQFQTIAQPGLNNREIRWPRGKVLGGSSAINGLYVVRQNEGEQNAWANLLAPLGPEAQNTWRWPNVLNAFKKTETFRPNPNLQDQLLQGLPRGTNVLPFSQDSHGSYGPIYTSWPGAEFEDVGAFLLASVDALGLPITPDPYGGNNAGPHLSLSSINPNDWTRSYARPGYIDPALSRQNLFILVEHQASKILFDENASPVKATGVQFSAGPGAPTYTVNARKEIILSAGVIGSPQLLQLSGVADRSVLDPLGIPQVIDLPGVGFHLQDHMSNVVTWAPKGGINVPQTRVTGDPRLDSYVNSAIGYVPFSKVLGSKSRANALLAKLKSEQPALVNAYGAPESVKHGFDATTNSLLDDMYPNDMPAIEVLFGNSWGVVQVQCALQHPLTRGSLRIASTSVFDKPIIDGGYARHDADIEILREGCKLARQIGQTAPLDQFWIHELTPGAATQNDDQWDWYVRQNSGTEFHPSSSCSMLPLDQGGVVDDKFLVYHTQNLRVIDTSVPPLSMSEHLMSVAYALGELGADAVKATAVLHPNGYQRGQQDSSGSSISTSSASTLTSTIAPTATSARTEVISSATEEASFTKSAAETTIDGATASASTALAQVDQRSAAISFDTPNLIAVIAVLVFMELLKFAV